MVTYPEDWQISQIDKIASITTGCRDVKDSVRNGRYPFYVRSKEIERINFDDFNCEAVLTAGDGGAGKIFHYVNGKFAAHQRVYVLSKFEEVDGKYFYYFFSKNFLQEVEKYTAKSTVDSVRRPMIANMEFPLPPIREQQAIASVLSDFDEHIDNLTKLIEKKKAIRDGALEDLVSGRTRLDGFDGKWEEKSFKDLGDILTGLTYSPDNIRHYGKLVIRSSNVKDNKLSFVDNVFVDRACVNSEDIKKGDIIICVRNGSVALIGKSAYASSDLDATFGAFMSNFRCKNNDSSRFVYYFTKSVMFKNFVRQILGATINQITKTDLKRVTLNIPVDVAEQQAITSILTAMDEEIESLEIEKDKVIQIREGAMDDLLTGRVRLKV